MAETNVSPMRSWLHWLQLTRPWNVLAMGIMVTLVLRWQGFPLSNLLHLGQIGWVLVPMLVGAAGNLINDYFDVREDRINKPERALVGRSVKRRVVLVTHWGFTTAALGWSGWLSASLHESWPILMVFVFSLVLYLYSPFIKGRGAWGNLAISLCVGGLVIWGTLANGNGASREPWAMAAVLTLLNFIREWVKDIQDADGDRVAHHDTMALQLSESQNKWGVLALLSLTWMGGVYWLWETAVAVWIIVLWGSWGLACLQCALSSRHKSLSAFIKVWMGLLFGAIL